MSLDRRGFLVGSASAACLAATRSAVAAPTGTGDLRVAVIGVKGRGKSHIDGLRPHVVALCDVDRGVLDRRAKELGDATGRTPDTYVDYRELLEKADVDAVAIATPNHTHCLIAIAAIQAGKHVYVEKPVSHNVWEGRQLVAAARRHNAVVQCGTQSRSSRGLQEAVNWVQRGELGRVLYAQGTCYKPRKSIGKLAEPLKIPSAIDYDLWCGPAEKRELYRPQLHYDWHWDWNTGNGDMGNQGIHQMDIARWFLGEDRLAPRTRSVGGRLGYDDAGDTPNTQVVYHAYESAPLIFETRGLPNSKAAQSKWGDSMDNFRGSQIGVIVQCEEGHVVIPSYSQATAYDRSGRKIKSWNEGGNHFQNWLDVVAGADKPLNGEIQEGHLSSALCHTGGASQLLAQPAPATEIAQELAGDPLFSASFDRMASHLRANDVAIDGAVVGLGPWVEIDTETERFAGAEGAEPLFKRAGRGEFAIPDLGA